MTAPQPDPTITSVDLDPDDIHAALLGQDPCLTCLATLGMLINDDDTVSMVITHSTTCTELGQWLVELALDGAQLRQAQP